MRIFSLFFLLTIIFCKPEKPDRSSEIILTVGGNKAKIQDFTSQTIQLAVDSVHRMGGGTVRILPGIYKTDAPVKLYSNIILSGSGASTILQKSDGFSTALATDADSGSSSIVVKDVSGFDPGTGVKIFDSNNGTAWKVSTAVIESISGNILYLDQPLMKDYHIESGGTVSNACSVISVVNAENVRIENLTIDGNSDRNDAISGHRGGGVYLYRVKKIIVENLVVKNFKSDGISWQTTEDVTVRNCEVYNCANAGLHPGTRSLRSIIEGNYCHDNDIFGMFICWEVTRGIVRNNRFNHNGKFGICTGHKDSDMRFEKNEISDNGCDGVHFRLEDLSNAPHRNIFINNLVENNGWKNGGYGFSFNSPAEGIVLESNSIGNSKGSNQKAAICIDEYGLAPLLKNNKMYGHSKGEIVKEKNINGIKGD